LDEIIVGWSESTTYDHDAHMWINGSGRIDGLPLNQRATDYILVHSKAAAQGHMTNARRDGYGLYGPGCCDRKDGRPRRRLSMHFQQVLEPGPSQGVRDSRAELACRGNPHLLGENGNDRSPDH
jgi:hypothetical protein